MSLSSSGAGGPERRRITDAQLEALLRDTGARPAAPPERAGRVRVAALAVFQAQARARRRRLAWRFSLAAAAILLAALAVPILRILPPGDMGLARVERVSGPATFRGRALLWSRSLPARPGEGLGPGSEVSTSARGMLAFSMASGGSVRLAPGTRVRLLDSRIIQMERGTLYVDSEHGRAASLEPIEIRTPLGRVLEKGTQFEVQLAQDSVRVRVRRGAVEMRRGDTGIDVAAGRELEVDSKGGTRRSDVPIFGS